MVLVKRIGWILVGVVIGALTSNLMAATRQVQDQPASRLVVFGESRVGLRAAYLVKDTKSDGCWLTIGSSSPAEPVALAPAPPSACYNR